LDFRIPGALAEEPLPQDDPQVPLGQANIPDNVVDIGVLGPLVVSAGGRRVRLGPALRVLLLALLCARGDSIPAGRLASLLSETGSADRSPATLRSHVAHLRREIAGSMGEGEPVIVTDRVAGVTAYGLSVGAVGVDAWRFTRKIADGMRQLHDGDVRRAGDTLRSAIALWRGQPMADAAGRAFAQPELRQLESSHRAAVLARIQADAQCGMHSVVIGELQALAQAWPADEAVHELLITCLWRSGRTAEAARACLAAVETVRAEGLDSRRLATLQYDVLNGTLPWLAGGAPQGLMLSRAAG
jgi:DNA-binding SARP family transcriptional activator